MPTQEADQSGLKELAYVYEVLGLFIRQWKEFGQVPTGQNEATWKGLTPKQAWKNGYACGYMNCADALEFALRDYLESTD